MKQSWIRRGFLLGLAFFMLIGASSCTQPNKDKDNKKKEHKVSWNVVDNGATGYNVVAKVGGKTITNASKQPEGAKVSFEVTVPSTHEVKADGWSATGATITVDSTDSKKASFTLGEKDVNVTITLTKKAKPKVSWNVVDNEAKGWSVEAKVGNDVIVSGSEHDKNTKVDFVLTVPDTHILKDDTWVVEGASPTVSQDKKKASITLGDSDVNITITLTNKNPKIVWEFVKGGAEGAKLEVKIGQDNAESGKYYASGTEIKFEVKDIPATHKMTK